MIRQIAMVVVLLSACDTVGGLKKHVENKETSLREKLDINLAKTRAFYVQAAAAENNSSNSSNCDQGSCGDTTLNKLVAVQDDGTIIEVQVTIGGQGGSAFPRGVIDTPAYLFFLYEGVQYKGKQCGTIPVRKSDGAMFCVETQLACGESGICGGGAIQTNLDGSFIYMLSQYTLSRLELKGIDDSHQTEIASKSSGGAVEAMVVNHAGDLLARVGTDIRFYKAGGGFVNVARGVVGSPCVLTGPGSGDDFFWAVRDEQVPQKPAYVGRVFGAGGEVTGATIATDDAMSSWKVYDCFGPAVAATTDATYLKFQGNANNNGITEILNPTSTPRRIEFPELTNIATLAACTDHLVISGVDTTGHDVVERFFPNVPTTETLAATKDYIISKIAVDSTCRITFGGRRSSDNARIVGQIEPGSQTVTVVAKDLSADVTQILAIH